MAWSTGAAAMASTEIELPGDDRKALAASGEERAVARAMVAACAADEEGRATTKLRRTLAAATWSETASMCVLASIATLERSERRNSGV